MADFTPALDIRRLYDHFDAPVTALDCGTLCAPLNPRGKPFCCDICEAVPAAYIQEWDYLHEQTDLWHTWRGDECTEEPVSPADLAAETPAHMLLLACQGPAHCQRSYRALSCRQFPFFPYISSDDRFLGLACEWEFDRTCWVLSHLEQVSEIYRREAVAAYDELFAAWPAEYESYYARSEQMRLVFAGQRRRIRLLHRNGGSYLVSPTSERARRVANF